MSEAASSPVEIRRLWLCGQGSVSGSSSASTAQPAFALRRRRDGRASSFITPKTGFGEGHDLLCRAFVDSKMVGAADALNQAIWSGRASVTTSTPPSVLVDQDHRRGIGEKLFKRILRAATNHGVKDGPRSSACPTTPGARTLKIRTQFAFEENSLTGRLTARHGRLPVFADSGSLRAARSTLARR